MKIQDHVIKRTVTRPDIDSDYFIISYGQYGGPIVVTHIVGAMIHAYSVSELTPDDGTVLNDGTYDEINKLIVVTKHGA